MRAKKTHPDRGGSHNTMAHLNRAIAEARRFSCRAGQKPRYSNTCNGEQDELAKKKKKRLPDVGSLMTLWIVLWYNSNVRHLGPL
jgi:hypothetical protein